MSAHPQQSAQRARRAPRTSPGAAAGQAGHQVDRSGQDERSEQVGQQSMSQCGRPNGMSSADLCRTLGRPYPGDREVGEVAVAGRRVLMPLEAAAAWPTRIISASASTARTSSKDDARTSDNDPGAAPKVEQPTSSIQVQVVAKHVRQPLRIGQPTLHVELCAARVQRVVPQPRHGTDDNAGHSPHALSSVERTPSGFPSSTSALAGRRGALVSHMTCPVIVSRTGASYGAA